MQPIFERSDTLNTPFECFMFDAGKESFPITPHWHYFVELIYVTKGTALMYQGKDKYIVPADGIMLFHPKSVHSIYPYDDSELIYAVLKFDINLLSDTPSYSPKLSNIFRGALEKRMPIYFNPEFSTSNNCKNLFISCIEEYTNKSYGYDLVTRANIYSLLTLIIRSWQEQGFTFENSMFEKRDSYDVENISEYIDQHIGESLEVADIANMCGLSYPYFAKRFKKTYGVSCKEYIDRFRIFKVEDYLLFTDFDLTYISQETGFADCSHMIKQFKKYNGTTPKKYRLKGGN